MASHQLALEIPNPPLLADAQAIKQAVDKQLQVILSEQIIKAQAISSDYAQLLIAIQELIGRGGKRLRPLLAVWPYAGFGGLDTASIIQVAVSQELLHASLLMHDDIIDQDTVRWGGPNIAGHYRTIFAEIQPSNRASQLADNWALMAGDICTMLAFEQLITNDFSAARQLAASRLVQQTYFEVLGGEVLDVLVSLDSDTMVDAELLRRISIYKTASYSFIAPLTLGALFAGRFEQTEACIKELGTQLGIAYQLQDDLLGMFGDERTGKSVLSDLREGKKTLLMYYALTHCSSVQEKTLRSHLGDPKADLPDLETVKTILHDCGAEQRVRDLIKRYYDHAAELLPQIGWQAPYEQSLSRLFETLLTRQS